MVDTTLDDIFFTGRRKRACWTGSQSKPKSTDTWSSDQKISLSHLHACWQSEYI